MLFCIEDGPADWDPTIANDFFSCPLDDEEPGRVLLNQAQQQQRKLDEQSREIAALERQLSDVVRMSERLLASLQILQANDPRVAMR